jgi:hypothetical protein
MESNIIEDLFSQLIPVVSRWYSNKEFPTPEEMKTISQFFQELNKLTDAELSVVIADIGPISKPTFSGLICFEYDPIVDKIRTTVCERYNKFNLRT